MTYYNLFLKNYLMINYQATRNLLGHPDLHSWVPGWATGKKFLNHTLPLHEHSFLNEDSTLLLIFYNLCFDDAKINIS